MDELIVVYGVVTHTGTRRPNNPVVVGMNNTALFQQNPPSTPSSASNDYRLDISVHSLEQERISDYHTRRTQSKSSSADVYVMHHPPDSMLPSSSDIKLPPSMKSRGSTNSPDDDHEETIPGIRYPPSWGQHRSTSPQGVSRKMSSDSSESFHSAESHHGADYNILTSLDPPKTKIMVSLTCQCGHTYNIV